MASLGDHKMPELPIPISHTITAINTAREKQVKQGDALGLSMSQISSECNRQLWYLFRWTSTPEKIDGQKQSIFNTGNSWEKRLLNDLEAAGFIVERTDLKTGKQFRIELADGWLRGKMDGTVRGIPEAPKALHIVEIKSMNENNFKLLKKKGLELGKPDHYAQCCLYMHATKIERCLYLAVNKNSDEIYSERIKYDRVFAARVEERIKKIVYTDIAPPKLFNNPDDRAAYACQWCPAKPQCHEKQFARTNCRTCIEFSAKPGAIAYCELHKKELSYEEQQTGCDRHLFLPSLVPGEQIDASEKDRTVTYKLSTEQTWVDGTLK
jgi:hypothetical protein